MGRKRKRTEYTADLETTTDPDDCRVWAWGVCVVGAVDTFTYGTELDDLLSYMMQNPGRYWFHNLKFDSVFIMCRLLELGYRHVGEKPGAGEFSALIDGLGKVYRVQIGAGVELADSYKKISMSVAAVADTYKLPYGKGEIDYTAPRPKGHQLTAEELDYLKRDVCIMAQAMAPRLAQGTKLTTGSDCLEMYKGMIGNQWEHFFPKINILIDDFLRGAYRGGWVYVNPHHQGQTVGEGGRLDVNSLYPWALRNCDMPYGAPAFFKGEPPTDGRYWVARCVMTAHIKSDGVPCVPIQSAALFGSAVYGTEIDEPLDITVCSVDWELWNENYDIDVYSWWGGYAFSHTGGLYSDYIDYFMSIKERAQGGERYQAKLFANNLYGKEGQKVRVCGKIPYIDESCTLHLKTGREDERDPVYLPVAIFTTAHARTKTIRTARLFGDRFCYADTDSIHFIGRDIPGDVDIHPSRTGAWKLEARFIKARFVRPKTYAEVEEGGHVDYKCAGMCDELKSIMRFDDFKEGFKTPPCTHCGGDCSRCYSNTKYWGLRPKNVPHGVVLCPTPFSIK